MSENGHVLGERFRNSISASADNAHRIVVARRGGLRCDIESVAIRILTGLAMPSLKCERMDIESDGR